jgi:uncharacterized repeat protein (TIGR03803 family)
MDARGNLYGTASNGGSSNCTNGCGTVYKLTKKNGHWVFATLYSFQGGNDGAQPWGKVVIGPNGSLYGATAFGGGSNCTSPPNPNGCGMVFNLRPPPTFPPSAFTPWNETVLYRFQGGNDGAFPFRAPVFDAAGAMYGSTYFGGNNNQGTAYKLTPSDRGYTESILFRFDYGSGTNPVGTVAFDRFGNLFLTAVYPEGSVVQLTPSGDGWTPSTIHDFSGSDGANPIAGVILDGSGDIYGVTASLGPGGGGTVFELTPQGGGWIFELLYSFAGGNTEGPQDRLVMDAAGNLYGVTGAEGTLGLGSVFRLSPSGGDWTYTDLYDFTGGTDGCHPYCDLVLDANGNLYGTASSCGSHGYGVVFEITP